MNYYDKIDPIGESDIEHNFNIDLEHDLICGIDTDIKSMHNDLNELNDLIYGYKTYTPNTFMLNQLEQLHHKLVSGINAIESGYTQYKNLHE